MNSAQLRYVVRKSGLEWQVWDRKDSTTVSVHDSRSQARARARTLNEGVTPVLETEPA